MPPNADQHILTGSRNVAQDIIGTKLDHASELLAEEPGSEIVKFFAGMPSCLAILMGFTCTQLTIFSSGKNVFITGGTGYLGRVLIHKLLSYCTDIGDLYLLVREKKGVSQEKRLEEMRSHFLFQDIEKRIPGQLAKMKVVQGDMQELGEE